MPEIIERVARAIYEARAVHFGEAPRSPPVRDERWELCLSYARAAIEATQEPIESALIKAGADSAFIMRYRAALKETP